MSFHRDLGMQVFVYKLMLPKHFNEICKKGPRHQSYKGSLECNCTLLSAIVPYSLHASAIRVRQATKSCTYALVQALSCARVRAFVRACVRVRCRESVLPALVWEFTHSHSRFAVMARDVARTPRRYEDYTSQESGNLQWNF